MIKLYLLKIEHHTFVYKEKKTKNHIFVYGRSITIFTNNLM